MSVTLQDSEGNSLSINAWNWGVLHFTLTLAKPPLLEPDVLEPLRFGGVALSEHEVIVVREFLEGVVLPRIPTGHRMMSDLSVTDTPDDGTLYRDQLEKNYSLPHNVLVSVIQFLHNAHPPVEVG